MLPSTPILQGFGACAAALLPAFRRTLNLGFPITLCCNPPCTAGCLQQPKGPLERQRALRWEERLRVTQSSLASQVWARLVCGDVSKAGLNEVEE